eukprot:comp9393_c0_seq1/m.4445 comp9393_c0_seq1/g.4445  ORF comp9393_c0_seq1/g.4445 comp9393_c0_seq1/m.4445 type:complete len:195 (-) comp9393_c0_seq1:542-1126(-)
MSPVEVFYCGVCTMPPEYCEYSPSPTACKEWLKTHNPQLYAQIYEGGAKAPSSSGDATGVEGDMEKLSVADGEKKEGEGEEEGEDGKKRQTRGGKGMPREKKAAKEVAKKVVITRKERGKRKYVTVVTGLTTCEIDVKKAAKAFGSKFACGSSVTAPDEIVVQGDVLYELAEYLNEKMGVEEDDIHTVEDGGRR